MTTFEKSQSRAHFYASAKKIENIPETGSQVFYFF